MADRNQIHVQLQASGTTRQRRLGLAAAKRTWRTGPWLSLPMSSMLARSISETRRPVLQANRTKRRRAGVGAAASNAAISSSENGSGGSPSPSLGAPASIRALLSFPWVP